MRVDLAQLVVFLFGIFNLIGGVIGYFKAGSRASLIAGSVSGILLLGCAYGISKANSAALWLTLIIAFLLGGRFAGTWMKNKRVMPDLLMILFSVATVITVGSKFFQR